MLVSILILFMSMFMFMLMSSDLHVYYLGGEHYLGSEGSAFITLWDFRCRYSHFIMRSSRDNNKRSYPSIFFSNIFLSQFRLVYFWSGSASILSSSDP
jgi:hypothetical protein